MSESFSSTTEFYLPLLNWECILKTLVYCDKTILHCGWLAFLLSKRQWKKHIRMCVCIYVCVLSMYIFYVCIYKFIVYIYIIFDNITNIFLNMHIFLPCGDHNFAVLLTSINLSVTTFVAYSFMWPFTAIAFDQVTQIEEKPQLLPPWKSLSFWIPYDQHNNIQQLTSNFFYTPWISLIKFIYINIYLVFFFHTEV